MSSESMTQRDYLYKDNTKTKGQTGQAHEDYDESYGGKRTTGSGSGVSSPAGGR